jgi:acyl-CoA synthetase (AMP-forming)/AMP-acid ligase II
MEGADLTIPRLVLGSVAAHGDRPAVAPPDGPIVTYEALLERALRAGAAWRALGVEKGDRVGIWLPNSLEWVEAALGAFFIGAVVLPVSTRMKGAEAAYTLRKSAAKALLARGSFLGADYAQMLEGEDLPALQHRIRTGPGESNWLSWEALVAEPSGVAMDAVRETGLSARPDDLAEVIFTSGTTGFPKGAKISHRQVTRTYGFYADRADVRPGDRYLVIAPMFHSFGFKAGVIVSLAKGAAVYPVEVFDAGEALQIIAREKITVMGGPPTIFTSLLEANRAAGRDISSLHSIVTGGSMVDPAMIRALQDDVGVDVVVNAYGLTETTALVTMTHPDDPVELIAETAGRAIDGVEVRCVDAEETPVPAGEPGEIQVRGYNVTSGYFEDEAATATAISADGWFRTGDVGILDHAGYLRITDRIKDMIIVGGFNVYPAEIERIILTHPDVREVALIGVADPRMGEVGKAFVVPRDPAAFDPDAFIAWCRERMANYKVPRAVEALEALPRNPMGKIQKFLLRPGR